MKTEKGEDSVKVMGSKLRGGGGGGASGLHLVIEGNSLLVKSEKCNFPNMKLNVTLFFVFFNHSITEWVDLNNNNILIEFIHNALFIKKNVRVLAEFKEKWQKAVIRGLHNVNSLGSLLLYIFIYLFVHSFIYFVCTVSMQRHR